MTRSAWSWRLATCAVTVAVATASNACGRSAPAAAPQVIKVGYAGEADFIDLPSLVAHDRLRARGYTVETTFFSASDVAVQAVSRGWADVIHGSMISAWTAVGRGARLRTVMDHVTDPYRLIAGPGVSRCADLHARRLAVPGESAVTTHLVHAFIAQECPSIKPEFMLLGESTSQSAALLAGGIDAVAIELSSWLWLQKQAPDRFTVLSDFFARWPTVKTTGVHVNVDFAARHGDVVRDYLRALVDANRDVKADPGLLVSAANAHMGRSEDWPAAARAYLDARVWPEPGTFTRAAVDDTLSFFKTYSRLDRRLTADAVADVTFLEAILPRRGQ
jgi:ABC-type nitrate/sulfonate/bicarbonate transport system substrate-binding protein